MVRYGSYLANAYTDHGHFGEAERVLGELLRHEREMNDLLSLVRMDFALARTYAEEGRTALAERYSRRLLARLEHSEEQETLGRAHLLLAEILLDRRDATTAERHLEEAQKLMGPTVAPPELALITVDRARLALQRGDFSEAEALARQALAETEATEPSIAGSAYAMLAAVATGTRRRGRGTASLPVSDWADRWPHRYAPHQGGLPATVADRRAGRRSRRRP